MKRKTSTRTQRKLVKDWVRDREGRYSKNGKVPVKYFAHNARTSGARQNSVKE